MKNVNVRDFGAKGDGCTLDTVAIQRAIDACEKGDTLVFDKKGFKRARKLLAQEIWSITMQMSFTTTKW